MIPHQSFKMKRTLFFFNSPLRKPTRVTEKQTPYGKTKTLRQNKEPHDKTKFSRRKTKNLTAKANFSRQNKEKFYAKLKKLTIEKKNRNSGKNQKKREEDKIRENLTKK